MLDFLFRHKKPPQPLITRFLVITEGVLGYWHYHVSYGNTRTRSLCDKQTMHTSIPLERWGVQFGEQRPKYATWCQTCEEKMKELVS